MALSYVGGATATSTSGADASLTLPGGIAEGDLVIVGYANGSGSLDLDMAMTTSGYTERADVHANDSFDANFGVYTKVMGATPDSTAVCANPSTDTNAAACHVWSGADSTLDATTTTATGIDTGVPNPPSITTNTDGAVVIALGGGPGDDTGTGTPSGYSNYLYDEETDGSDAAIAMASKVVASAGAENPGSFTGFSTGTVYSWCAATLAIKEAIAVAEVEQEAFRFRNDDGSETTATWRQTQNTNDTIAKETAFRLRYLLDATGDPASMDFQLEFDKVTGGSGWEKLGSGGSGTITFVGAGTVVSNSNLVGTTGIALSPHASTLTDDVMIAFMHRNQDDGTFDTVPAGWTQIDEQSTSAGQDMQTLLAYRVATSDSEGTATFTHSDTTGEQWAGVILTYRGVDTSTPLDVTYASGSHFIARTNKATPNVDAFQSITTNTDGAMVVALEAVTHDDITSNADPSGYTNAVRNIGSTQDYRQLQGWHAIKASAGVETPGAPAYTSNAVVAESHQYTIALKPGSGTPHFVLSASSNITASGENTTSQLTGGTGTFVTGRMQDDENPADAINITDGDKTEVEWCLEATIDADEVAYKFRVTDAGTALDTYTATAQMTIAAAVAGAAPSLALLGVGT